MRLEILAPCSCPKCARLPDGLSRTLDIVHEVDRLENQRQRGEEGAILHEVALDRRWVFSHGLPEPWLELGAPAIEYLLRLGVESDVGDLTVLVGARTESLGTEVGEILEYVIRPILGLEVGPAVDRIVAAEIRVHEYLKALEETVGLLGLFQGVRDVGRERTGLDATEDRDADSRDMQRAAPDPVDAKRAIAVPRLEVEGAVSLPASLIKRAQTTHQLVAVVEDPVRVVSEDLGDLLDSGVVGHVASLGGRLGLLDLLDLFADILEVTRRRL